MNKNFTVKLKIHCKIHRIKYADIAKKLGITSQELHNLLNGFQLSVPSKNIKDCKQAEELIRKHLSLNF